MATPQQQELQRNGLSPADPASAKTKTSGARPGGPGRRGPVPADNQPGHHPDHDQDKPLEAFVERAEAKVRESRAHAEEHHQPEAPSEEAAGQAPRRSTPRPAPTAPAGHAGSRRTIAGIPTDVLLPPLAVVDAARRPAAAWQEIGQSRSRWVAGLALVPALTTWRYATAMRPRLDAAEAASSLRGA